MPPNKLALILHYFFTNDIAATSSRQTWSELPSVLINYLIHSKKIQVQDYSLAVNSYTKNLIDVLIPKRIIPFDFYEQRDIDCDVRDWIQDRGRDFAVILGDAGMGKTNLLCKLADELIKGGQFAVFFVKCENLTDERFDENILRNLDLKGPGLNLTSVFRSYLCGW